MHIRKTQFPGDSLLATQAHDYTDSFLGIISDPDDKLEIVAAGRAFFSSAPKWVEMLFALRNRLVSIFGLKTKGDGKTREEALANFEGKPGERLGLFKVLARSESEMVFGEDDKHLDFRVSFLLQKLDSTRKGLYVSTTVCFNNRFGRIYFAIIRPFHNRIVPVTLKGIIRQLEKE